MTIETIPFTDRDAWLAMRVKDLTASDIAAVAGVDPSRTPLRIYAEKTGKIPPTDDNNIMRRGRWLEAAVIEALRDERPAWEIRRAGVYLRDPETRLGATPDAVAIDPTRPGIGNVQCKVVARPAFEKDWDQDGDLPPLKFQLQTLAESMLLEASWAVVAALVVTTYSAELVIREVARHDGAEQRIREMTREFWSNVERGVEPLPVYANDADVVAAIYKNSDPSKTVNWDGDNRLPEILAERAALKAAIKSNTERCDAIETEIKAKLGEAETGELPGWRVTWKPQTRKAYSVAETTFRKLTVTERAA